MPRLDSLLLGQPCSVRAAYDYQQEPNNEQNRKSRVVHQAVNGQQRGCYDQGESPDSCDLANRSHRDH